MLDIAQDYSTQDSRIVKLQKEEVNFSETRPIERKARLIESRSLQNLIKPKTQENI